jgi:hypothetical protein
LKTFSFSHAQIDLIFLYSYHQFPASSSQDFALKPGFWLALCRLLGRIVSHIHNIRLNRQCSIFQDCERFGKPFFCGAVNCPREGCLHASMRRGLWLFLASAAWGTPASPPNSPWRSANRSMAAPAIGGNRSSAESIYVGGSWRRIRRTTATAGTGAAAIPHAVDRASDPRLAGPMLQCGKQGIKTAANQLAHSLILMQRLE